MRRLIAAMFALLFVCVGCTSGNRASTKVTTTTTTMPDYATTVRQRAPSVVVTALALLDATKAAGAGRVSAVNLLPLDPFGPVSESKADELRKADVAVILGKGTQPAVEAVAAQRSGPTVRVLDGIDTVTTPDGDVDPYVWMNPQNMATIVKGISLELQRVDPVGDDTYRRNLRNATRDVRKLDDWYARTLATCDQKVLVTTEPSYQYMANRYGLRYMVVTKDDAGLDRAKDTLAPRTVYFDELPSVSRAREIRDRNGMRVSTLDPVALQPDQPRRAGANYWTLMDINLDALRAGLGCDEVSPAK